MWFNSQWILGRSAHLCPLSEMIFTIVFSFTKSSWNDNAVRLSLPFTTLLQNYSNSFRDTIFSYHLMDSVPSLPRIRKLSLWINLFLVSRCGEGVFWWATLTTLRTCCLSNHIACTCKHTQTHTHIHSQIFSMKGDILYYNYLFISHMARPAFQAHMLSPEEVLSSQGQGLVPLGLGFIRSCKIP